MFQSGPKGSARGAKARWNSVVLRAGDKTHRLYMFPGAGCDWREVEPLASLVDAPWSVIGIEAWRPAEPSMEPPSTVEQMAGAAYAAIKGAQPRGPYRLAGYSFGGLVALEAADALIRSGEEVQLLALVDCVIYERFWSVSERVRGRLNQIVRILRMPAGVRLAKAMGRAGDVGNRLVSRLRRQSPAPPTMLERCEAAYRMYRPRAYAGRVVLFGPDRSRELGIDLAEFWRRFAGALDVIRVPGGHHELVRSSQHTKGLALALNDALRGLPTIEPRRRQ